MNLMNNSIINYSEMSFSWSFLHPSGSYKLVNRYYCTCSTIHFIACNAKNTATFATYNLQQLFVANWHWNKNQCFKITKLPFIPGGLVKQSHDSNTLCISRADDLLKFKPCVRMEKKRMKAVQIVPRLSLCDGVKCILRIISVSCWSSLHFPNRQETRAKQSAKSF